MHDSNYEYRGLVASSWDFLRGDPLEFSDRRFFLEVVEKFGAPVLDVGCGTGRLLLELRSAGVDVDGLDSSPEMLEICRKRAQASGLEARLFTQEVETMQLPRRYRTIIVPSCTFQLVHDLTKAENALVALHRHLLPGGTLVLSIWSIRNGWTGEWNDWWLVVEKDGFDGKIGIRRWERSRHDPTTQLRHTENRYELVEDGEVIYAELHRQSPEFRNYSLRQIVEMMSDAGYVNIEAVSGYSFDPASDDDGVFCVMGSRAQRP